MDAEVKAKWLEALRSGEYTQGEGRLRNRREEFCCLGVLCDVLDKSKWSETPDELGDYLWDHDSEATCETASATTIPDSLAHDLGIDSMLICKVISMNDSHAANFTEIAQFIEDNF